MAKTYFQSNQQKFASVGDFLDYLEETPIAPKWDGKHRSSQDTSRQGMSYNADVDYQDALKLARTGWEVGTRKISDKINLARADGKAPRWKNSVAGAFPDVGRYLSNQPDCMKTRFMDYGLKKPIIDVVVSACRSGDVTADSILNVGAALCAFIDQLEDNGYQVGVSVFTGIEEGKTGAIIEIKHAGQAMPLSDMAFFIAHPAFQRRLGWQFRETIFSGDEMPYGYGTPCTAPKWALENPDAIIFPRMTDNYDMKNAVAFVNNVVRRYRPDLIDTEGDRLAA